MTEKLNVSTIELVRNHPCPLSKGTSYLSARQIQPAAHTNLAIQPGPHSLEYCSGL